MDIEIFKGSIDILILCALNSRTSYGYEIIKLIKKQSNNTYEIGEGTLYASLKRLEGKDLITSFWEFKDDRNRKYYNITNLGKKYLDEKILGIKNLNILLDNLIGGQNE
ncbi:PadR family transcriptional regulator [Clostridium beijerinckii]|uniref:DNA-binding PadR family transcriptional regulator n=1 Tax=Clostridium beijerinckii TaxID=1520 RepID=A0AAX0AXG7_CLOBE|nr:PadR family transcriptional regulator [Clostridium beijerinckii]MBA8934325.1 DNA-binding PadR family transcriptional regulator [Clostridium beijerinckii]NRT86844.1 DNA-binding PadR family transcriptional regulator [Clostridium beijerinckii]NRU38515.1 DNA-binding PadR family transcriptional regulator [Clostridium beijerinckii]NSA98206.1 DNA-binding PadR family transcriptional regulator [Clostridium beijerinckii]NYC72276.1 DNA-binding PadR family transcriptional regulator [Clostridium beijeri